MKQTYIRFLLCALLALGGFTTSRAQLTTDNTYTPTQLVQDVLLGSGIQAFNITYTGAPQAIGFFSGGNNGTPALGIDSGVVMTTGTVLNNGNGPQGPNNSTGSGEDNLALGDTYLDGVANASTFNAAILEFDFIPLSDSVKFNYSFGSEEYMEWIAGGFADVFAFVLSGVTVALSPTNIALIPNTTIAVTALNVNANVNSQYYVDNENPQGTAVQYDGFTTVLQAIYPVQCGETYHIRLAIADALDGIVDAGVFLEAGSFTTGAINVSSEISYGGPNDSTLFEGCGQACLIFARQGNLSAADTVQLNFTGSAINGGDFIPAIPNQVIFQPGQDTVVICISAVQDLITEGLDTLNISTTVSGPCVQSVSGATIYIGDFLPLTANAGPDTAMCSANPVTITANGGGGVQPYTYSWSTGDTTQSIVVSPSQTTSYIVEITDPCGSPIGYDTVTVYLPSNDPLSIIVSPDYEICEGDPVILDVTASGGSSPYTYSWTTISGNDSVANPNQATNQLVPTSNGTFLVLVEEGCGATRLDSITVILDGCDVIPPNVFTPNGDGTNDVLVFQGLDDFPGSRLYIYNRWGNKIYENIDYTNNWNGDGVSDGTYYYVLDLSDGRSLHGFITILKDK
jgi:gliding motility-associated-like protein